MIRSLELNMLKELKELNMPKELKELNMPKELKELNMPKELIKLINLCYDHELIVLPLCYKCWPTGHKLGPKFL
jgi:hypothetical protein